MRGPRTIGVQLLVLGLLCLGLSLGLGCRPQPRLGEGPPKIDGRAKILSAFEPAALAGPPTTGLQLDEAVAGPPEPPEPPPLPDPEVVDYGPTGEASDYPTIQVRFNRPMVALGDKQRVSAEEAGFEITPKIPGAAYWAEPTRLVFEPEAALPRAQEYEVKLRRRIEAVDGPALDVDLSWRFGTEPPRLSMRTAYDDRMADSERVHWKAPVELTTSAELSLRELREHLRVEARSSPLEDPQPVEVRVRAHEPRREAYRDWDFEIRPKTRWPAGAEVILRVDGELRSKAGPRPLGRPYVYSFRVAEGVRATQLRCSEGHYADGCELGPVRVRFSAPITRAQAKRLRVSPEPRGLDVLAVDRLWDGEGRRPNAYRELMLWGEFARGVDYEVIIDERLRDVHGQAVVGTRRHDFRFVEPPPSLALVRGQGTFMIQRGARLGVESRHVERLRVRIAKLDEDAHERLLSDDDARRSWPEELAPAHEELITLKHDGQWGWSSHELDLSTYTGGRAAALFVEVAVDSMLGRARGRDLPPPQYGFVQITALGVSALGSLPEGVLRVARLADDAPVAGAAVELVAGPGGASQPVGKTDARGLLTLPGAPELPEDALLRVRAGDDAVLLDAAQLWAEPAPASDPLRTGERARITLMSERPLYKPGERVRAMGWAAIATPYELSGLRTLPAKTRVRLELRDHRDELVAERVVQAKAHGKFWATLEVPETAALGDYALEAELLGASAGTTLQVKDFPVPAFEVQAAATRSDLHGGESTTVRVDANYFFGGRVPITRARATTTCEEIDFRPPGLEPGFTVAPRRAKRYGYGRSGVALRSLPLDAEAERGHLEYEITPRGAGVPQPLRCTHSVAVADASETEIGAEATVWVHPSFYLAAQAPRALDSGEDARVELATVDYDGSPVAVNELRVELERSWLEPEYLTEDGERRFAGWQRETKILPVCETASTGAARCDFTGLEHGDYRVRVSARGEQGDYAPELERWLWVREVNGARPPRVAVEQLEVALEGQGQGQGQGKDQAPQVGETVRAQIRAPWSSGSGLVAISKGGLHQLELFELEQGRAQVELEVSDAWIPGVSIHALAIEPGDADHPPQLRFVTTEVEVASEPRELHVELELPEVAQTREKLVITARVHDAAGEPVDGHVSVWAVDEAVLSLAPLELPDFVTAFAVGFSSGLDLLHNYGGLRLPYMARPDAYRPRTFHEDWASGRFGLGATGYGSGAGGGSNYGSGGVGTMGGPQLPAARSEFSSAPIFIGDAKVEAGVAKLEGELPDNLTTFRVTAVASAPLASGSGAASEVEARFGSGDARVRVTRPLVVRAALPRILRPGDQAELGVLVDNLDGGAGEVEIEVELKQAEGVVELLGPRTATAPLGAGKQLRVPFAIRATSTGTPQLEVRARLRPSAGGEAVADALRLPLPVEPERTLSERVAVYGSLDDDGAAVLPFALPAEADPNFGGLSVSVGATLLGGLEDAVAYLINYPHGCLEQTASSLLPLIPLGRLARQGYPLGVPDLDGHVAAGVARLRAMQLQNGGFAYWPGGERAAPYASAYATWVLHRAAEAGYRVPEAMLDASGRYLAERLAGWSERAGPSLGEDIEAALMLSVLAERGRAGAAALARLWPRRARLPVFAQATLLLALEAQARNEARSEPRVAELLAELRSLVDEREAVAKVETNTRLTWYWDSDARSSALVLMAMLRADPEHPLVSKLARGLLEARRGGRWANTQENAYALIALADYAAIYEAEAPDFDGRVWLGAAMLASIHVAGRGGALEEGFTPMTELLDARAQAGGEDRLILERAGQGRMYYRVGLEWASTTTDKPARAEGIELTRTLRGPEGVISEDQAVRSGDLLAIDLQLELPAALDHVAVEIPLPAGLQAVDLELGKGGAAMKLSGQRGAWVSHQELRRDRAVIFADHLAPGLVSTTVFLRATTPGDYLMPAAHAEMMYYPEVYGRTRARRLLVR